MASNPDEDPDEAASSILGPSQPASPTDVPGSPGSPPPSLRHECGGITISRSSPLKTDSQGLDGQYNDSDADEDDRENRFEGPSSTWLKYTAEERSLAASLDQQRANNISIQMYNAHAWKAHLRDPARAAAAKPWQSKSSWLGRDHAGKVSWHPDAKWTAWPLPAADVPRKEESFGADLAAVYDEETYRKSESWRPSRDLEDELQALMMRKAKERLRRRTWIDGQDNNLKRQAPQPTDKVDNAIVDAEHEQTKLPTPVYHRPELLADDEEANDILKPTLRHILTKVDDLLTGLHKSRAGQRKPASTTPRTRSKRPASRSRSRSQARPPGGGARSATSEAEHEDSSDVDASSEHEPKQKRRPSGQSKHGLGQRDWSDVLGMAALAGWDPAVLDRAARRCASLFGETMAFRAMPEAPADAVRDEPVEYRPDTIPPSESDEEAEQEDEMETLYNFCPFETCKRHVEAFAVAWQWRQHLHRQHGLSKEDMRQLEQQVDGDGSSTNPPKSLTLDDAKGGPEVEGNTANAGDVVDIEPSPSDVDESMIGAVHRDGFMQPIIGQLSRGKALRPRRRRSTAGEAVESPPKRQRQRTAEVDEEEEGLNA